MGSSDDKDRFWQIQAVFACEGHEGPGFAYTMGMASRGLHELHMWDRPTHGDDPGADFHLSSHDLGHILNTFGDDWASGTLAAGDVQELSLEDGLTTAIVTLGEPVDANSVEAWGARPARVVPLAWSLHRPPRGEPVEIMEHAREAYEREIRAVAALCDPRVTVSGAQLPGEVIPFDVDGPYGPLSALVEAHARAVAGIPDIDLLIANALAAETAVNPAAIMGRMATLSRLSGRDGQLEQIHLLGHRVIHRLAKRRAWRNSVATIAGKQRMTVKRASHALEDIVGTSTMCALMGFALDDVLPEELSLAAQGPWRTTLSDSGADPGQRWRCSEEAERAIRRTFAGLDELGLLRVVRAMAGPVIEVLGDDLMLVHGLTMTTAVAPPPVTDLVLTQYLGELSPPVVVQLSMFAELMATVIDGALVLGDERSEELESIFGWPLDDEWWNAA